MNPVSLLPHLVYKTGHREIANLGVYFPSKH